MLRYRTALLEESEYQERLRLPFVVLACTLSLPFRDESATSVTILHFHENDSFYLIVVISLSIEITEEFVQDNILHIKYSSRVIPPALDDLGSMYEGYIENRIGVNLPMRVLKVVSPGHRLTTYQADYIII